MASERGRPGLEIAQKGKGNLRNPAPVEATEEPFVIVIVKSVSSSSAGRLCVGWLNRNTMDFYSD